MTIFIARSIKINSAKIPRIFDKILTLTNILKYLLM